MENTKLNLIAFLQKFDNGEFDSNNTNIQISAGWFDWFCADKTLRNRLYKLVPKLKKVIELNDKSYCKFFNPAKCYVIFKNNCSMNGTTYDDFRICSLESDDVLFTITPKSGQKVHGGKGSVWGKSNNFKSALVEGSWKEILNYFKIFNFKLNFKKLKTISK